jgi:hypothetical protein
VLGGRTTSKLILGTLNSAPTWTFQSNSFGGFAPVGDIEVNGTWGTDNKEAVLEFLESMGANCANWTVNGV